MEVVKSKEEIKIENLPLRTLRQRMFIKQSEKLYGKVKYSENYVDNLPEQIEALPGFTAWEKFSETWDVYWVGLDPRTKSWIAGRKHSPVRELVLPLRIVKLDERTGRMEETYIDRQDVQKMPVPKDTYEESDKDRAISNSLSGKVVIDEPDEDKAARLISDTIEMLEKRLLLLKK